MPAEALPPHLRNWQGTGKPKLHNDWIWPLSKTSRGSNAFGPRCPRGSEGYLPWPPRLLSGRGVSTWELGANDSKIEIPELAGDGIFTGQGIYGLTFDAIERKPGHPLFGQTKRVRLLDPKYTWPVLNVKDEGGKAVLNYNHYTPSAIQIFSKEGFLKMEPDYYSAWSWWNIDKGPLAERWGFFTRRGYRPDHLDVYYNKSLIYVGLKGE